MKLIKGMEQRHRRRTNPKNLLKVNDEKLGANCWILQRDNTVIPRGKKNQWNIIHSKQKHGVSRWTLAQYTGRTWQCPCERPGGTGASTNSVHALMQKRGRSVRMCSEKFLLQIGFAGLTRRRCVRDAACVMWWGRQWRNQEFFKVWVNRKHLYFTFFSRDGCRISLRLP